MGIRVWAIVATVGSLTFTFGALPAAGEGTMPTETLSINYDKVGSEQDCRDGILAGTANGDSCTVEERSTECDGKGIGKCDCEQTTYFDTANVYYPPSLPSGDPSCYAMSLKVDCTFQHGESLRARAVGELCVLPGGNFLKSTGWLNTSNRDRVDRPSVVEIRGNLRPESSDGRVFKQESVMVWNNVTNKK